MCLVMQISLCNNHAKWFNLQVSMETIRASSFRLGTVALICILASVAVEAWRPWPSLRNEGSSDFVQLRYYLGPILTSNITIHPIWYGNWTREDKQIIKDFLVSISDTSPRIKSPSVSKWWNTLQQYSDQTGANVTSNVALGAELNDRYSHGKSLTRLQIQSVINSAVTRKTRPLPIDAKSGLYLVLTSPDVFVQDFCRAVCGFHYFTYPSIAGYALPYAWVGNSATQCPGVCAYPFAAPSYLPGVKLLKSPNNNVAVDGMISVIGHELAELATDTFGNGWYAGGDPSAPNEIADLCEGIYGTGGGGSYTGQVLQNKAGASYNINGLRRQFLVQWLWSPALSSCYGPNSLDE